MKILINGNFLNRNLTGIERFAWEICHALDSMLTEKDDFSILVSSNARVFPEFKKIKIVIPKVQLKSFVKWDLSIFKKECKKLNALGLNFSTTAPFGKKCGFAFIHDIYAASFPEDFVSFRDKLVRLYCLMCYRNIAKNALKVFTVSGFSKELIAKKYSVKEENICVIPNGWEHFAKIESDTSIMEKHPELKKGSFYFTLGSLSRRKNLKWIVEYSKKHLEENFAISGKAISGLVPPELEELKTLKNIVLLGYVSDGEVKCLMENCRAFIFPSYYEGFGIPPLEALSCGTSAVVAKSACLPEIYGNTVHYIDPFSTDISLSELLKEQVENPSKVLEKFTYKNAAELLLEEIRKHSN